MIDADALKQNINTAFWAEIGKIIDDAPTIDAVEVVRCRECKYNINNAIAYNDDDIVACFGWCELFRTYYGEDAYCPFGERRPEK